MADDLNTRIGFDATEAIATLNRLEQETRQYNDAIRAAAEGTRSFNRAGRSFDKTVSRMADSMARLSAVSKTPVKVSGFAQVKADMQGVTDAQTTISDAVSQTGANITASNAAVAQSTNKVKVAANKLPPAFDKVGQSGAESGKVVLLSWQSVVRIFAIQTIHRAITVITNAFADGVSEALDYQVALAEIQTIGGDLGMSLGQLGSRVREISEQFAQPLDVVAEGLYQTLSNQVTEGSEAFEFLTAANKFAVAAVTDTASAVNLLSSAINAYGFASTDAEEVAGKLFKTIELGRIRGEEFANTYGRVLVLSAQLGVSFDAVNAAVATLTVQGLKYNEAFTLINNIQLKLIRPTDNLKQAFKELGIASAEAGIQAFGFEGFLNKLTEATGDSASEIGDLFNRVRAIRGVLGLAGSKAEQFAEALDQIKVAGAEDLGKAFETIFETDAKKFEVELTRIKNIFTDTFGKSTIKLLNTAFAVLGGGPEALAAITAAAATAASAYIIFATGVITKSIALIASFTSVKAAALAALGATTSFVLTPLGGALALGAAIAAIVVVYNQVSNAAERARDRIKEANAEAAKSSIRAEKARRAAIEETEESTFARLQQFLQKKQQLWQQDADFAEGLQNAVFGSIDDQMEARFGAYEQFVGIVRDATEKAADALKTLENETRSIQKSIADFNFERSIKGLNDQQKSWRQIQRSQDLVRDSNRALLAGDRERAKELAKQAESVAKQAVRTADSSKNSASIAKAVEQTLSAQQQQLRIQNTIAQQQISAKKTADKIRAEEEARLVRIKAFEAEVRKLQEIIDKGEVSPDIDLKSVREKMRKLTTIIQEEYDLGGKNARILEQYEPEVTAFRKKFEEAFRDPITGVKIDFTEVIDINLGRILAKLNAQADSIPEGEKIAFEKLTGVEIGGRGMEEAQKALPKVEKDTSEAATSMLEMQTATAAWKDELVDARGAAINVMEVALQMGRQMRGFAVDPDAGFFGKLGNLTSQSFAFLDLGNSVERFATIFSNFFTGSNFAEFNRLDPTVRGIVTRFTELETAIEKSLSPDNFSPEGAKTAKQALFAMTELATRAGVQGYPTLAKAIQAVIDKLDGVVDKAQEAARKAMSAETLAPLEEANKAAGEAMDTLGIKATDAGDKATDASNRAVSALGREARATLAAADAYRQKTAASGGQMAHYGALVRRQLGGLAFDPIRRAAGGQIGMDSVPVLAQPGESFNTVNATRKFFPQIQAMNAGIMPSFNRVDTGTTNNFGDINIEVPEEASPRETAREIMKAIKRESRRQTFNTRRSR